eukprot:CAMPEP_0118634456 /NCGR_PEP_ID=MMETSP0785-20121206/1554_1 /TAXON_ID=91992 /ORGANISM="Bolidomonas pacifica, Strain CCMP 1866" /LENGTH=116 /DNA_ID=CAMNT_0006525427 /DNA_START=96 /DNA_END=442 /DNA_ORIENTATION=-
MAQHEETPEFLPEEPDRCLVQYENIPVYSSAPHLSASSPCSTPLKLQRDPYSEEITQFCEFVVDGDLTTEYCRTMVNMTWMCDACGIEGRLRFCYSCPSCETDYCVPCSLLLSPLP